jgi:COP9 signalosome complex subunit 7
MGGLPKYNNQATLRIQFADFRRTDSEGLPKLLPAQHQKLLLLSLLPLARNNRPLSYSKLQQSLSLSNVEALESLVTSAIYAELVDGALDPSSQIVHVDSVAPLRDLQPGSVPTLVDTFQAWSTQCGSMLEDIQKDINLVHIKAKAKAQRDLRIKQLYDSKLELADEKGKATSDAADQRKKDVQDDIMDLDDAEGGRGTRSKRSLFSRGGRRLGS